MAATARVLANLLDSSPHARISSKNRDPSRRIGAVCAYQTLASALAASPRPLAPLGNIFTPASSYTKSAPESHRTTLNPPLARRRPPRRRLRRRLDVGPVQSRPNSIRILLSRRFASTRRRNHANAPPETISVNTTRSTAPRRARRTQPTVPSRARALGGVRARRHRLALGRRLEKPRETTRGEPRQLSRGVERRRRRVFLGGSTSVVTHRRAVTLRHRVAPPTCGERCRRRTERTSDRRDRVRITPNPTLMHRERGTPGGNIGRRGTPTVIARARRTARPTTRTSARCHAGC